MIEACILTSMALELLLFLGLFLHSRGHVLAGVPGRSPGDPLPGPEPVWPPVAVIIPLTGNTPEMKACLESLLDQDYPEFETVLVTRDPFEPAACLVRELLTCRTRARHVVSGPARECSQKNHSLLAGLALVDDAVEILVFCDSSHRAAPHFLRDLVRPLAQGEAVLTTGFHRIIAGDFRLATLGMLQIALTLQLLLGWSGIAQPWGGATAIRRAAFDAFGVKGLWSENVVDDLSLGVHLGRAGIRVKTVPNAILTTHLEGQTVQGWTDWLTRQLMYPKYLLPGSWLAASLVACLLAGPLLAASLACLGGVTGLVSGPKVLVAAGFLVLLSGVAAWYRTLVPQRIPLGRWLAAFYAAISITVWSYFKTWTTDTISWRGISYRVGCGGQVRQIMHRVA